jgi:hypothetical protein
MTLPGYNASIVIFLHGSTENRGLMDEDTCSTFTMDEL